MPVQRRVHLTSLCASIGHLVRLRYQHVKRCIFSGDLTRHVVFHRQFGTQFCSLKEKLVDVGVAFGCRILEDGTRSIITDLCFPTRVPRNIVRGFVRSRGINKWIKSLKCCEKFQTSLKLSREVFSGNWQHWKFAITLILRRSRTGTVWFYTSTSNKRAAWPKLYIKSLTRDLKLMYSRLTLVRISINL